MKVYQAGYQNVVALMGSTLPEPQERKLIQNFDEVILMLDGARPGRVATEKVAGQLAGKIKVSIASVPDGAQPDQLDAPAIRALLEPERQRPANRQNSSTAESPNLRAAPDEAKLEV